MQLNNEMDGKVILAVCFALGIEGIEKVLQPIAGQMLTA